MGEDRQHQGGAAVVRNGNVLFGADERVAAWVAERIPGMTISPGARALGVLRGDDLVAGVVFERWNGVHVEASIAADTSVPWASRSVLFNWFHYPFVTLDCEAITVLVPSTNPVSLNLALKLGFEPEALVRFAAPDGSTLIVLKQFRNACRWISHGQGQQASDTAGSV
jgi:RimJ/RimL family protein N-acetyltransferase